MINHVILRGFVADEPYIHATDRGILARLRMATSEYVEIKGQMREIVEWHTVLLHGDLADIVDEQVRIGSAIEVEGKLRNRKWVDRAGTHHDTSEVAAHTLKILERIEGYRLPSQILERMPKSKERGASTTAPLKFKAPADDPDDIPF